MSFLRFVLLLSIIISCTGAKQVCHGYGYVARPKDCISTCSINKDDCPSDKKCCYRIEKPCGYHCVTPKDDIKKSGECPSRSSDDSSLWFICDVHVCDVDNDCKSDKKCCLNACGSKICINPNLSKETFIM